MKLIMILIPALLLFGCSNQQVKEASVSNCHLSFWGQMGNHDQKFEACRKREIEEKAKCEMDPACSRKENYPVTAKFLDNSYSAEFEKIICHHKDGAWPDKSRQECESHYKEAFLAKLQEIYARTDWEEISLWCKANPMECLSWDKVEAQVKASHDMTRLRQIAQENEDKRQKAKRAIGLGLQSLGKAMRGGATCASNVTGSTIYSTCSD